MKVVLGRTRVFFCDDLQCEMISWVEHLFWSIAPDRCSGEVVGWQGVEGEKGLLNFSG